MRIEKITFQQTFPTGEYQNQKLGIEIMVQEDDSNYTDVFIEAKRIVELAFHQMNPQLQPALTDFHTGQQSTASDILNPHEGLRLQKLIDECKTPDELDKLYDDAVRYGLSPTWDKKLRSLQNQ